MLTVRGARTRGTARAQILYDLSLEVGRGEVVALMGRNGAGKSTTMKAIMGMMRASAAARCSFMRPRHLAAASRYEIARLGLGFVPEDRRIFTDLTVMENLDIGRQPPRNFPDGTAGAGVDAGAAVHAVSQSRRNAGPARRPHERRRAADADGGAHADGQSAAGAARRALRRRGAGHRRADGATPFCELKQQGLSILLSEQNIHFAELVSDRAYVLEKGQIRWQGTMPELAGNIDIAAQLPHGLNPHAHTHQGRTPASSVPNGEADAPYVLDEQVGFLLRIAMQRHTAIFMSQMAARLTQTQFAALAKLLEVGAVLAEPARAG